MRRASLALALLLALAPTALATWGSSLTASSEPSTVYDTPDVMWQDPPPAFGGERVYFDVLYTPASIHAPFPHYEAILGAWRDCNSDGVIGSALGETYPTFTLLDLSVCPPGTRHDDGATVTELLWIGPGAPYPHYDIADASVWMDALVPGEGAPVAFKVAPDAELHFVASAPRWVSTKPFAPEPAHATGYAHLGSALAQGLHAPSFAHAYGADVCPPGALTYANWDCDPTHWWPTDVRVGDVYEVRDTDCTGPC